MQGHGSNGFLVMCQRRHRPVLAQIPEFNRGIMTPSDHLGHFPISFLTDRAMRSHLGIGGTGEDGTNGIIVTRHAEDLKLCSHVPDATNRIPSSCHDEIQCGVQFQRVDAREMSMIVANNLWKHTPLHRLPKRASLTHTLLASKSQHITFLSNPDENM